MKLNLRYAAAFIAIVCLEILIAVFVHDRLIRPYIGDMLVVVVVYCFLRIFLKPYRLLPLCVFVFAAAVEIAQYFDFVALLGLQDNRVLSIMLGATFDPADLGCYLIGCLLLALWQRREIRKSKNMA